MGPERTDAEVFLAIEGRADAPLITAKLAFFAEKMAEKGEEVQVLREQLVQAEVLPQPQKGKKVIVLARIASRLSDDISKLAQERDEYVATVLNPGFTNPT